jgi:hypothetical protein
MVLLGAQVLRDRVVYRCPSGVIHFHRRPGPLRGLMCGPAQIRTGGTK